MRRSKTPPQPTPFVLLRDVFPDLSKVLRTDLRRIGRKDLAEQVIDLRIYDRCRCPSSCGTFYCVSEDDLRDLGQYGTDILGLTVAKGRIIRVETLSPQVDAVLKRIFPDQARAIDLDENSR